MSKTQQRGKTNRKKPVSTPSWRRYGLPAVGATLSLGALAALVTTRLQQQVSPATSQDLRAEDIDDVLYPPGDTHVIETSDGAKLHVVINGNPEGPAVVLAHGWTADHIMWTHVTEQLISQGYCVIAYDQRGHGQSTWTTSQVTISRLGVDLAAILQATDALRGVSTTLKPSTILVGHSMGGMTVQALLTENPSIQDNIAGAVLVSTSPRPSAVIAPMWLATLLVGDRRTNGSKAAAIRHDHPGFGRNPDPRHLKLVHETMVSTQGAVRAACMSALSRFDVRKQLNSISVPVQVIVGDLDRATRPQHSQKLVELLDNAELQISEGVGHLLPLEDPAAVVTAIENVLQASS